MMPAGKQSLSWSSQLHLPKLLPSSLALEIASCKFRVLILDKISKFWNGSSYIRKQRRSMSVCDSCIVRRATSNFLRAFRTDRRLVQLSTVTNGVDEATGTLVPTRGVGRHCIQNLTQFPLIGFEVRFQNLFQSLCERI